MIKAVYKITDQAVTLTVKGHAGYDEQGRDIVCAAVSSLVTTLANHLASSNTAFVKLDKGYAKLKSHDKEDYKLFVFVFEGIKMISRLYPKNISFFQE